MKIRNLPRVVIPAKAGTQACLWYNTVFAIYTRCSFFLMFPWVPAFAGMTTGREACAHITLNSH